MITFFYFYQYGSFLTVYRNHILFRFSLFSYPYILLLSTEITFIYFSVFTLSFSAFFIFCWVRDIIRDVGNRILYRFISVWISFLISEYLLISNYYFIHIYFISSVIIIFILSIIIQLNSQILDFISPFIDLFDFHSSRSYIFYHHNQHNLLILFIL